jgi:hypothetical protein
MVYSFDEIIKKERINNMEWICCYGQKRKLFILLYFGLPCQPEKFKDLYNGKGLSTFTT